MRRISGSYETRGRLAIAAAIIASTASSVAALTMLLGSLWLNEPSTWQEIVAYLAIALTGLAVIGTIKHRRQKSPRDPNLSFAFLGLLGLLAGAAMGTPLIARRGQILRTLDHRLCVERLRVDPPRLAYCLNIARNCRIQHASPFGIPAFHTADLEPSSPVFACAHSRLDP